MRWIVAALPFTPGMRVTWRLRKSCIETPQAKGSAISIRTASVTLIYIIKDVLSPDYRLAMQDGRPAVSFH